MSKDPLQAILLIERDVKDMMRDLDKLDKSIAEFKADYYRDVVPNINSWNATSQNITKIVWVVISAVVVAVLALIGIQ